MSAGAACVKVTASILDVLPGDVVLAEAIGASTIDPATVVAGPFKLTWSQRQHVQPGLVGPTTVPTDDASGRDVRLPVHIGWRKLTPRDGRYKMFTRTTEPVEVKLVVPPTWLVGGDRPVLVVQQEGRVERISLEPPQLLGVVPSETTRGASGALAPTTSPRRVLLPAWPLAFVATTA